MEKKLFYRREFLNRPGFHSTAAVFAELEDGCHWPVLQISDCNRQITFDLHLGDDDLENTLHKLDVLARAVTGLRKACYEAAGMRPPRL